MNLFWKIFLIIFSINVLLHILGLVFYQKRKHEDLATIFLLLLPCQLVILFWLFIFDLGFEWSWF